MSTLQITLASLGWLMLGRWWGVRACRRDAKRMIQDEREWWANAASVYGADSDRLKDEREHE